jgi:hypothetical protein
MSQPYVPTEVSPARFFSQMGTSRKQWRAAVGQWPGDVPSSWGTEQHATAHWRPIALLTSLLVIGGVELNPGPQSAQVRAVYPERSDRVFIRTGFEFRAGYQVSRAFRGIPQSFPDRTGAATSKRPQLTPAEQASVAVTLYTCIREVLGSDLDQDTVYPDFPVGKC